MNRLLIALLLSSMPALAAEFAAADLEFFEKKIRPVLAEHCFKCHSADAKKLKGGLLLDHRAGVLKGGDSGPSIVSGKPEESLLIEAIGYDNVDLEMPPRGRLSDQQIADLTEWVKRGAPWPKEAAKGPGNKDHFNLAERKADHWAWQPVKATQPPKVKQADWPASPIDQFILAKLEAAGLKPAGPADKRALIRRAYFDLIGLPPTPEQVQVFVADNSPKAFEKVVDELLASQHFGERWGRHWLDLMRYAETFGHEFDFMNQEVWRYRDYVIRAFNGDVPYDRFVKEHIAGDLLQPRYAKDGGWNESRLATAWWWLGQHCHSPVDVRAYQAEVIDNQIDVIGKAFQGMTIACARCHDHKFDAISTADYYALYGLIESGSFSHGSVDGPEVFAKTRSELEGKKEQIRAAVARQWRREISKVDQYLLVAHEALATKMPMADLAKRQGLDAALLDKWAKSLQAAGDAKHPLHAFQNHGRWQTVVNPDPDAKGALVPEGYQLVSDVRRTEGKDWFADGASFANAFTRPGEFVVESNGPRPLEAGWLHSGKTARKLQGTLRSPTFKITANNIHLYAMGKDVRVNVVIDNFKIIRNPIYGGATKTINNEKPHWFSFGLAMWKGHHAYVEFCDLSNSDPAGRGSGPDGWAAVQQLWQSNGGPPRTGAESIQPSHALTGTKAATLKLAALRYEDLLDSIIRAWSTGKEITRAQAKLMAGLIESGLLPLAAEHKPLIDAYVKTANSMARPTVVPVMLEGTARNEQVFIRGSHKNLGGTMSRRYLTALVGEKPPATTGTGRRALAHHIADASNPLTARVYANRIWHHLLGRGIVPSTDNFGVLGEAPTHPALLDWLANYLVQKGWSTKEVIRAIMLSQTYRMSSRPVDAAAEEKDPANNLLHRMRVRRLQGEAIRDSILSVSGRLDKKMFGPPVAVHLTSFMEGRGRPRSGPLDGAGRRTVYQEVRRNFLSPMMLAFDMPQPLSTFGRRTSSNVPAQALIMMNDPFVVEQSRLWGRRMIALKPDDSARIVAAYELAFSREPTELEQKTAIAFLQAQAKAHGEAQPGEKAWADFCHALMNVKEFVFVN